MPAAAGSDEKDGYMKRVCDDCHASYDDARCVTYCPHDEFISAIDAARKDHAAWLTGRRLRLQAEAETGPDRTIQSIDGQGYVMLTDGDGPFNPFLFMVME